MFNKSRRGILDDGHIRCFRPRPQKSKTDGTQRNESASSSLTYVSFARRVRDTPYELQLQRPASSSPMSSPDRGAREAGSNAKWLGLRHRPISNASFQGCEKPERVLCVAGHRPDDTTESALFAGKKSRQARLLCTHCTSDVGGEIPLTSIRGFHGGVRSSRTANRNCLLLSPG